MSQSRIRTVALAIGLGAIALLGSACYGYVEPAAAYGYEPAYYDGYVVYYDGVGRPYYYYGGAAVYIAPTSPYYRGYVDHYRYYGPNYGRWYSNRGYQYRTYRAPAGRTYYYGHPSGGGGHPQGHHR
ncbi:MAG TPA: hypothetical protein VLM85_24770 [Polyangiaceae bacterium]|nr:hypothetical protein [Polyangiaceae bacterium]